MTDASPLPILNLRVFPPSPSRSRGAEMARLARVVVPGIPHHVTQRGNRRQPVFLQPEDYQTYLALLQEYGRRWGLAIWAYGLMTNHVHLIVVPATPESLTRAIAETHRRYTRAINFREGWRGYLWQGRFASFPMDEPHLAAAMRYVERNPVAAGLVRQAEEYPWSSAPAHVTRGLDPLLSPCFLTEQIPDWRAFLATTNAPSSQRLERHVRTGRPLGDEIFLRRLEAQLGRRLHKAKPGPKLPAIK